MDATVDGPERENSEGLVASALRMNCNGVSGEPNNDADCMACDAPSGVEIAKEGRNGTGEPGLRARRGGLALASPGGFCKVEALIHFSSFVPGRGGDSGINLNRSAKWSLINLNIFIVSRRESNC